MGTLPTSSSKTSLQDILQAKGIQVSQPGKKEKKGSGGATIALVKKFSFAKPPAIPSIQLPQTADERRSAADALKQFRAEVVVTMHDYVSRVRAIDAIIDADEKAMEAQLRGQLMEAIGQMLSYEPPFREPAVLAYADALVRTCPEFRGAVEFTIKALVEVGFLAEVGDGKGVRIYGGDYVLAEGFKKNLEAKGVAEVLTQLVSRTVAAGKRRFEEEHSALKLAVGDNPLSVAELKAGKEGRVLLETPDHQNRDRFYKGGILLLEVSNGGQIRVLGGVGGCQRVARQLAEAGAYVWNTQLGSDRLEMKERLPEETFRNVLILHGLIFRGITAAEKAEAADTRKAEWKTQTAAERVALKAKATLSLVEFFLFGFAGTVLLDPLGRKPFEIRSKDRTKEPTLIWDVIALLERDERGNIRVADCPERLSSFLASFREWFPTGEKFSAVKFPLQVLLRMGYAAALAEATPEQKTKLEAKRTEAEAARKAVEAAGQTELAAQLAGESVEGISIPDPAEGR